MISPSSIVSFKHYFYNYNFQIVSNSLIYLVVTDGDLDGDEAEVVSLNETPVQSSGVALKSPQPTTKEVKARSALKSGAKRIKIEESDNGSVLSVSNNTTSVAVMKPAARSMFSPTRLKGKPATRVPVPLR
jgi:hypothetical protein